MDARSACPTDWGAVSCKRITLRQRARGRGWARRVHLLPRQENNSPARTVTAEQSARGSAVGQNCPPARTVTAQGSPPLSPNACQGFPGHDRRACGQVSLQNLVKKFKKVLDFPFALWYTVAVGGMAIAMQHSPSDRARLSFAFRGSLVRLCRNANGKQAKSSWRYQGLFVFLPMLPTLPL